ncbi:hypothetical protein GQX74_008318, partial [Glossina fuscipes]
MHPVMKVPGIVYSFPLQKINILAYACGEFPKCTTYNSHNSSKNQLETNDFSLVCQLSLRDSCKIYVEICRDGWIDDLSILAFTASFEALFCWYASDFHNTMYYRRTRWHILCVYAYLTYMALPLIMGRGGPCEPFPQCNIRDIKPSTVSPNIVYYQWPGAETTLLMMANSPILLKKGLCGLHVWASGI